ncbi:unnamed protein product [Rangifer tarandus platyrhynchus]|uniref:Uncharacterized protein n=2 Tax=Rangifer tarandus platyrhynchus TaxID=3082113 RepID=A0ABN8Y7N3_RANTA|nr:unnamed protein product [Rangifer tarandus platyrhynchus]
MTSANEKQEARERVEESSAWEESLHPGRQLPARLSPVYQLRLDIQVNLSTIQSSVATPSPVRSESQPRGDPAGKVLAEALGLVWWPEDSTRCWQLLALNRPCGYWADLDPRQRLGQKGGRDGSSGAHWACLVSSGEQCECVDTPRSPGHVFLEEFAE